MYKQIFVCISVILSWSWYFSKKDRQTDKQTKVEHKNFQLKIVLMIFQAINGNYD